MRAVDTSVAVAAFASWHEHHEAARKVIDSGAGLIDHCALETWSVLTRLQPPHRAPPDVVHEYLVVRFAEPWLRLSPAAHRVFVLGLMAQGVTGGSSYDALIAATASATGSILVTCDRRAASLYERYGVRTEFLG